MPLPSRTPRAELDAYAGLFLTSTEGRIFSGPLDSTDLEALRGWLQEDVQASLE